MAMAYIELHWLSWFKWEACVRDVWVNDLEWILNNIYKPIIILVFRTYPNLQALTVNQTLTLSGFLFIFSIIYFRNLGLFIALFYI